MELKRYEVGIMSDKCEVLAPNAALAAMYYSLFLVNINNPFTAVVYTEDGQEWEGDMWWINIRPDEAHVKMVADRLPKEALRYCQSVKSDEVEQ